MRINKFMISAAAVTMLGGCAGSGAGPLGLGAVIGDRNLASAEPLFSEAEERCLDSADQLLSLIYGPASRSGPVPAHDGECQQLRQTFRYVVGSTTAKKPDTAEPNDTPRYDQGQRNEIIDALIASSNRKCTRYIALLKNADGAMNGTLSVGAIITGGLGAFVGGAGTAKALAGTASILSGSRAAINETYLSNQTIQVLAAAFEKARRDQRRIITNREECPIDQYTLMRGIEDALQYHNSCSLVVGLAETARSIERSENPGLDVMRAQFAELANLRRQAAELTTSGPITPIASAPTPASLDKLVDADKSLREAEATLSTAKQTELNARSALEAAKTALANKTGSEAAVTTAQKNVDTAGAATIEAQTGRDAAGRRRDAEVIALVRVTSPPAANVEPETRICPFRVKEGQT